MKKFDNVTQSGKEKAIKIGTSIPNDAVGLAFFSSEEINPSNTVSVLDLANTIPENRIQNLNNNDGLIAYADEFGVLRTADGRNSFPIDDLTIGDIFIDKETPNQRVNVSDLNPIAYVHYYYTSKHFIAAPANFSLIDLTDYLPPDNIKDLKIKVVNSDGSEYIDKNSSRKKYRILLEPFTTDANFDRSEIPHRVIVLLDADPPVNLQLVYDKVETDADGNFYNQVLRYTETINAVPYYEQVPEESFAIDANYYDRPIYSVKKLNKKYTDLTTKESVQPGYQIITNRKAIKDHRVFEGFNWRLIARSRSSLNLDLVNFGQEIDSSGNVIQQTIKVGVLYSSLSGDTNNSVINPYAFNRLEQSPFNLSKYRFINPNATTDLKWLSLYWKVDIDAVNNLDDYDILLWSPTSKITENQAQKILSFVRKSGTLVLDLSAGAIDASRLNPQLARASSTVTANVVETIDSSPLIDPLKNGGWFIAATIFERPTLSILGSNYSSRSNAYKEYLPFNNYATSNSFVDVGQTTASSSLGLLLQYPSPGDAVAKGNIIATAFPLLSYCSNKYRLDNVDEIDDEIFVPEDPEFRPQGMLYPAVVEGPFKLLYNIICYGLYSKAKASSNVDVRGSLYNFVSPWRSSWVMDPNALLPEEKSAYFVAANIDSNTTGIVRDIMPDHPTAWSLFQSDLSAFLPAVQKDRIQALNQSNFEFFIELTNSDVELVDATRSGISANAEYDIPSAYNLFKLNNLNTKLYAYTNKPSPQLTIPSTIGSYTITDQILSVSESSSLENKLPVLNNFKSYPFKFNFSYSYVSAKDIPFSFEVYLTNTFKAVFKGTLTTKKKIKVPGGTKTYLMDVQVEPINIKSAIDNRLALWTQNSSSPSNCFLYSGDIDIHKDARIWKPFASPVHDFVRYIQFSMAQFTGRKVPADGVYGNVTSNAVKAFQIAGKQRYLDGTVDSETKSFIAFAWKELRATDPNRYEKIKKSIENTGYLKYIVATENAGTASSIGKDVYQKISFTGFGGPSSARDIIFFEIPPGIDTVDSIVVKPMSNPVWRNYVIDSYGYKSVPFTDITKANQKKVSLSAVSSDPTIVLGGISASTARYMFLHITGRSLKGYGYGEGFSIESIQILGKATRTITDPDGEDTIEDVTSIDIVTEVVQSEINSVSALSPVTKNFSTSSLSPDGYISEINYSDGSNPVQLQFSPNQIKIGSPYSKSGLSINFAEKPREISLKNSVINSIAAQDMIITGNSAVSITLANNSYTLETSATTYSDSIVVSETQSVSDNYFLRDIFGRVYGTGINTVTVNDGVMLLCNSSGEPTGLLSLSQIRQSVINPEQVWSREIDLRYGYLTIENEFANNDGFIYGFYDLAAKEFIGKTIPCIELIDRGVNNVYIGVCAIDADGNTQNKNEYIGPAVDITFKPINIPTKLIVPVFSVKYANNAAIRVGSISPNLSKFDVWELPITNGSFVRSFNLPDVSAYLNPNGLPIVDWKSNYKGQSLLAVYSTVQSNLSVPSNIFGSGYYDISEEQPLLMSDKTIQVRRTPILAWSHPTSYLQSKVGIVRAEVEVYIRATTSSPWIRVKDSEIRDVNCNTGVIEFNERIVPSNSNLIKINYVTSNKDHLVRQVDGRPIPLNPVLSEGSVIFNKPLYIYLMPVEVYAKSWLAVFPATYASISEYPSTSPINFTYDSRIFNSRSSNYEPLALPIAAIYVTNNPYSSAPTMTDVRLRGGGFSEVESVHSIIEEYPSITSHWDVYPPSGKAYPKGGYVIIRIPESVKNHFIDREEIYDIIRNNLTAGIVFDLQDLDGNPWS